uniref:Uncharacterized protein n=1 Tax=Panagrolaimus superbus TaxID=310955 RepID=A0A914Z9P7_9BILA
MSLMNFAPTPIIPMPSSSYHFPSIQTNNAIPTPHQPYQQHLQQSAFQPFINNNNSAFSINPLKTNQSMEMSSLPIFPSIPSTLPPPPPLASSVAAAAVHSLFPFQINPLMLSTMNRQLTDYRTLQQLLLEQQHKQLQYAPTLISPIIPKVDVSSPLPFPQHQQISTATSSIPNSNSPFISLESPQMPSSNIVGSGALADLRKSLQSQVVGKSRRQSFPLKERSSSSLFDGEGDAGAESLTTADDAIITEKTRMLIVSAATLTKLYGTKHHRHSTANSPIVEGNIRKGDLKCVVCQDKAVSRIYVLL